jgi:hypothetical protein
MEADISNHSPIQLSKIIRMTGPQASFPLRNDVSV